MTRAEPRAIGKASETASPSSSPLSSPLLAGTLRSTIIRPWVRDRRARSRERSHMNRSVAKGWDGWVKGHETALFMTMERKVNCVDTIVVPENVYFCVNALY